MSDWLDELLFKRFSSVGLDEINSAKQAIEQKIILAEISAMQATIHSSPEEVKARIAELTKSLKKDK